MLATQVLPASAGTAQPDRKIQIAAAPVTIADFELTDQDGRPFRFSRLRGADVLVFFGFSHCPDVCPATMFQLQQLTRSLVGHGKTAPRVVMISVDGERDAPSAMKAYLRPLSSEFIGLTGDPGAVRRIAAGFSAVFFKGLPGDATDRYLVEHTSQVYLVDREGRLRATFFEASLDQMSDVVSDLTATN
ncbi:MAG: SCO family protein [Steroidobacteraceae bacterium]